MTGYCTKCIMPRSRPGLSFDENGVCAACRWHETKQSIDWAQRAQEFAKIAEWARAAAKGPWHCVLGVSGGKDSTFQAFYLRDKLGLNPLLVQFISSDGTDLGRQNIENLVSHGFDLTSIQPNPEIARRLSRLSFRKFGNIHKYAELALFTAPWRVAMDWNIPLVFFGENPALEAGDTNRGEGWDASTIRHNNTLSGGALDIWLEDGIRREDLVAYNFPSEEEFQRWGGRSIFMGYYINWSGWRNGVFAIHHGMGCHTADYADIGIHYKHNSLDSDHGGIVNSMLKYVKLGFGNTTEFACYDVRDGRLSRAEAALLVKTFDGGCHPRYIDSYCKWVDLDPAEFHSRVEGFRGPMWMREPSGAWALRQPVWAGMDLSGLDPVENILERIDTRRFALEPDAGRL